MGLKPLQKFDIVGENCDRKIDHTSPEYNESHPTGWRSVAASAAQTFLKNDDLVREAVNCNAVLGESAHRKPS
ncbi:hypothetical protein SE17_01250 [Kouleothrix aurantiaca]|uniref:Uncharacterized protein n=1 Tax=Kouleothrix aurantiaca TaxID=186479 RepID=A0A0P9FDM0_9CHLR|nr:hypothetical protein SE17_01250 [Kouleothrix aurantiaca]